jgi:hypothetical protein
MNTKAIKRNYVCKFHNDCVKCAMKNLCVSATGVTSDPRKYLMYLKGYRQPQTESMKQGIAKHELYQYGMKSALKIPFHILRKELYSGREITYSELQICSPGQGLRGVIDIIKIKYDQENRVMNIYAEEIKSSYWKKFFQQISVYGLILSDLGFRIIQEQTKRKTKRITHRFYPQEDFKLNIQVSLQVFGKKPIIIDWMKDSIMTDWANGISSYVLKQVKKRRALHKMGLYWLNEIPPCSHCWENGCGYYKYCSKLPEFKGSIPEKQTYFGKKKILVKTKPHLNMSQFEGMVRIK